MKKTCFAKWSNSLFPLERLDEAAQSGQSYGCGDQPGGGEITETVGADVPEGVHITERPDQRGDALREGVLFPVTACIFRMRID